MKCARPNIKKQIAFNIFFEYFQCAPQEITFIEDEPISAAFACKLGDDDYVMQFRERNMAFGLMKERIFGEKLSAASVPIRNVIVEGDFEGLQYTIEKKVGGAKLAHLHPDDFRAVLPSVFETILALAAIDISKTEGFGWFDETEVGPDPTWQVHLSRIKDEEPGYFFGNWHSMFETTFLERERFERYYSRMMKNIENVSIPKSLVHGSFSTYNILVDKGRVTAILDWQDARFGDSLFDIASLDYWPTGYNVVNMFEAYCTERGIEYTDYHKRIFGCKYYQTLGNMLYFAKIGHYEAYKQVIDIAEEIERITIV